MVGYKGSWSLSCTSGWPLKANLDGNYGGFYIMLMIHTANNIPWMLDEARNGYDLDTLCGILHFHPSVAVSSRFFQELFFT